MAGVVIRRAAVTAGLLAIAIVAILWAQAAPATLRTPSGERAITIVEQVGEVFVPADVMAEALGGTFTGDPGGYRIEIGGATAGFAAETRFGAVGDELIEMPAPPIVVEGRPFVPWQFFRDVLRFTSKLDLRWTPQRRLFEVGPLRLDTLEAQVSVVELEETTKIVIELPREIEYTVRRDPAAFVVTTRNPLRANLTDRSYGGELLDRISVRDGQVVIQLASENVAGDAYSLEEPFRIVLDLQVGSAAVAPSLPSLPGTRPRDLPGVRTIVLDPGHGGKAVGAVGPGGLMEKDVTLAIARKLRGLLTSSLGTRVLLTRDDDSVVPLDQRTALANQYKADLFLSIHINAARSASARGAETYFLSLDATDEVARATAERENAEEGAPQGAPSSDLQLILWDLAQQEYLKESSRLAELVQEEMNGASGVVNRGVKQAPFRVLIGATMPAALVEVGFISNPGEEAKLASPGYQDVVAQALLRAIRRFKTEYEARVGAPPAPVAMPAAGAFAGGAPSVP
ncbi:MAG: N-acetylmuramoyl-L-alanine amidase [Thermoanaerobaculia bacterium]